MKGIKLCAECASYDMKKHRCRRGANSEENPQEPFYDDCPLPDVAPVVRCKDCKYWEHEEDVDFVCTKHYGYRTSLDFCSYGERKEETP